jgi:hypothetical protein
VPSWIVETPLPAELVLERIAEKCDEEPWLVARPDDHPFHGKFEDGGFQVTTKSRGRLRATRAKLEGYRVPSDHGGRFEVALLVDIENGLWYVWRVTFPLCSALSALVFATRFLQGSTMWTLVMTVAFGAVGLMPYTIVKEMERTARRRDERMLTAMFEEVTGSPMEAWIPRGRYGFSDGAKVVRS